MHLRRRARARVVIPAAVALLAVSGLLAGCGAASVGRDDFVDEVTSQAAEQGVEIDRRAVVAFAECLYDRLRGDDDLLRRIQAGAEAASDPTVQAKAADCIDKLATAVGAGAGTDSTTGTGSTTSTSPPG